MADGFQETAMAVVEGLIDALKRGGQIGGTRRSPYGDRTQNYLDTRRTNRERARRRAALVSLRSYVAETVRVALLDVEYARLATEVMTAEDDGVI